MTIYIPVPRAQNVKTPDFDIWPDLDLTCDLDLNPCTAGGLSHLRTAGGGGGTYVPPRLTRKLGNASTSEKKNTR